MGSFIICAPSQIFLGWSFQRRKKWAWYATCERNAYKVLVGEPYGKRSNMWFTKILWNRRELTETNGQYRALTIVGQSCPMWNDLWAVTQKIPAGTVVATQHDSTRTVPSANSKQNHIIVQLFVMRTSLEVYWVHISAWGCYPENIQYLQMLGQYHFNTATPLSFKTM
jgi:hypothetical protein